jgi:hypothetical protein
VEMFKRYMSTFRPDGAFFLGECRVARPFLTWFACPSVTVVPTNMLLAHQDFATAPSTNFREMCRLQVSCIVLSAIKSVCDQRGIGQKFILEGLGWSRLLLIKIDCRQSPSITDGGGGVVDSPTLSLSSEHSSSSILSPPSDQFVSIALR